ncbi:Epoxide hydrolase [Neofusicoccum parvum]|uniref:Epoxide hydrolase n=2 Tax=Neofusicoccum parvum TaxID=310453 RepID=A0ACB5SAB3_9PEZI|nr:putative epoxide hydrolase 2 protein [Neofusicoccum parvum UCRNP2]GME32653.1 Epoxide hydrolase [Neofusicoccum parvum]GME48492.1 Epoxide hydrolase [Neofusicoccum parvum]
MAFSPTLTENTFTHADNKHTTFYWSAGPPSGPLLIFVHGWPANGETWKPQLLALAALGFHTIAPDCRGYGRSSAPPVGKGGVRGYALEQHVGDLRALLAHLDRDRAVWVGHDWGAALVWGLAAHHPEACVGVITMVVPYRTLDVGLRKSLHLVNRELYPPDKLPYAQFGYQAFHEQQPERAARLLEADVAGSVKWVYAPGDPAEFGKQSFAAFILESNGWFGKGVESAPEVKLEDTVLAHDKGLFERLVEGFEKNGFEGPNAYYLNHDVNEVYSENVPNGGYLDFPVLFVEAKWDTIADTAISRMTEPMKKYVKNLTQVSIDSGHWVGLEKPEEVNLAIIEWLRTKLPSYYPSH